MWAIISCITTQHNLWLVALAAVMCISGCFISLRLYPRTLNTNGLEKTGWQFLSAFAAGCTIWSTHFIAMLGHEPTAHITFDPFLTILSLMIVITGSFLGIIIAGLANNKTVQATGGALFGLSIAAMHYTGMFAYRLTGLVEWDQSYIIASLIIAVIFSALSLIIISKETESKYQLLAALAALVTAIVGLHFTGMTALSVSPLSANIIENEALAKQALAISIAGVALLIFGTSFSSYLIDKTMRSNANDELRKMALHDPLTGLPNRTNFNQQLTQSLSKAEEQNGKLAVYCIDLNKFKEVNDSRGHAIGDEMLCALAGRLEKLISENSFVARLGGDEFAALNYYRSENQHDEFSTALAEIFKAPLILSDMEVIPAASIGLAHYPEDGERADHLINNADIAMFHAKSNHIETTCPYDEQMGHEVRARRQLAEALNDAIQNDELTLNYQRQTSLLDGKVCGYEALLRWTHPERGRISPADFIPLAEENGIIIQLGEWVLRRACMDAVLWQPMTKIAVNISAVQLKDANLPKLVHQILVETGLPPHRLELELTETAVIQDKVRSLHIIRQIKALGVGIALDDFGNGYSSLDTLRTFPFDKIKLDRTFIDGVKDDKQTKAIIRAVLALGKSLDIPVLAEGIETAEQMEMLQAEGCNEGQGYLLGHPLPLSELTAQLQMFKEDQSTKERANNQTDETILDHQLLTAEEIRQAS